MGGLSLMSINRPAKVEAPKAAELAKEPKCAKCDDKGYVVIRMNDGGPGAVNCACAKRGK